MARTKAGGLAPPAGLPAPEEERAPRRRIRPEPSSDEPVETMEQRQNGHRPMLRFGDLTPTKRPLEVNGRVLQGYVRTRGIPRSVTIEYDAAHERYLEELRAGTVVVDGEEQPYKPSASERRAATSEFVNTVLLVLLPGLTYEEADSFTLTDAVEILRDLEWFSAPEREDGQPTDPPATRATDGERSSG